MRFATIVLAVAASLLFAAPAARAQDKPKDDEQSKPKPAPGGPEEMPKNIAKFLKDQLELAEEQTTQVEVILRDAFREAMKKMLGRMGDDNAPSGDEARKEMEDLRTQVIEKIRGVLDDGQKKELEVLIKEFDQRAGAWEQRRGDPDRNASSLFESELASRERVLVKVDNALILSEDEKKVILPLVGKVHDARAKLVNGRHTRRRDLEKAIHSGAKQDEIKERLETARVQESDERAALKKAEDDLREVLTLEQEARLVALGILE